MVHTHHRASLATGGGVRGGGKGEGQRRQRDTHGGLSAMYTTIWLHSHMQTGSSVKLQQ
jgi:hypothetical protein